MTINRNLLFAPSILDRAEGVILKLFNFSPLSLTQDELDAVENYAQYNNIRFRNLQQFTDRNIFSQFLHDNENSLTFVLEIEEAVMNYHGCNLDNVDQLLSIIDPMVSEMSEKILSCLDPNKLQRNVEDNSSYYPLK